MIQVRYKQNAVAGTGQTVGEFLYQPEALGLLLNWAADDYGGHDI